MPESINEITYIFSQPKFDSAIGFYSVPVRLQAIDNSVLFEDKDIAHFLQADLSSADKDHRQYEFYEVPAKTYFVAEAQDFMEHYFNTKIQKVVKNKSEGEFSDLAVDFNNLVPMPNVAILTELVNYADDDSPARDFINRMQESNLDWYNWCCNNWGTKWNAVDTYISYSDKDQVGTIQFDTAWDEPEPVLISLSKKFPDYTFTNTAWFEGGTEVVNEYSAGSKENISETDYEWSDEEEDWVLPED